MNDLAGDMDGPDAVGPRARAIFGRRRADLYRRTDRLFAVLLLLQWLGGIVAVLAAGWMGRPGGDSAHLMAAAWLGLVIVGLPAVLALVRAGAPSTRYIVALAQVLFGALLIHLSGGRIEAHFHVFGSLAFLAIYRDWGVLVAASAVVALDHYLRGTFWPLSVFGAAATSPWRWLEHAGWVLFEDVVLVYSCLVSTREMRADALHRAELECLHGQVERQVEARTAELRENHALLRAVIDGIPDALFVHDIEGRFLLVNEPGARSLGLGAGEVTGRTHAAIFGPETAARIAARDRRILATGETESFEDVVPIAGEPRDFLVTAGVYRDAVGVPAGIVGVARDVTERKRAARENAHLAAVVDASADAIVSKDLDGVVTSWNAGAEQIFGYTAAEAIGRPITFLIPPDRADEETWIRSKLRGGERIEQFETVRLTKAGQPIDVSVTISPIRDAEGRVVAISKIARAIGARKRAEEELRRAKEAAEAANRAKSEFLANMSHEIRTPMNGVLGMTELALDTDLTPRQREYLGLVRSSAEGLLTVINDILDFSKIEAGKLALDSAPFGLRDALEETLRTLASRAHAKGLELACRIAPGVPDALVGDPMRLRQVVVNLVGNAIKFTEHGEVVVSVDAEDDADPVALHVTVADTGIGIPAEKLGTIFAPFEQADGSTTRRYGGTGLGLSISARLVAMMGGRIWVESEAGRGSTFHFVVRLDRSCEPLPVRAPAAARPPQLDRLPILVVDDNATNRRILVETLAGWGARPVAVADGPAAFVALRAASSMGEPFAVALVDGMMPGMDGFELAGLIRGEAAHDGLALLMLTSAGPPDDAEHCRALRISACLTKPVRQSELFDALAAALDTGPSAVEPESAAVSPGSPAPRPAGLRVLLAEDHPVNQKVAVTMLEGLGHTVAVASDGSEALAALDAGGYDVVLMDVQMPVMDGFEATAALRTREAPTGRHTPVIALTAHAMKGDRERCLDAGFDAYLPKPIRRAELAAALESLGSLAPAAP